MRPCWRWVAMAGTMALAVVSCDIGQTSGGSGQAGSGAAAGTGGSGTGGASGVGGGGVGGGGGMGGAGACMWGASSTLPHVTFEFPPQNCTFTLAEAAAGIEIDYLLIVGDFYDVIPHAQDAGQCGMPGTSNLIIFEELSGGGQHYCLCDTGLCPGPSTMPVPLQQGIHQGTFRWSGKNWNGPSDTGEPMGAPFPPGSYTLTVSAVGDVQDMSGTMPFSISGTFPIELVP